jgi:hypothetical protein
LSARIDQRQSSFQTAQPAGTAMTVDQGQHVVELVIGGPREAVEVCHRNAMRLAAAYVEGGALRGGDHDLGDGRRLAVEQHVAPCPHSSW